MIRPAQLLAAGAPRGVPGLRHTIRAIIGQAFGPPGMDFEAGAGDPGLFGPGSASWQLMAEPAAIVGGVRGLLVQLLHPLAVAGVADHSAFRTDPLGRLHRTSAYVTVTTFGTIEEVEAVAVGVRGAHRRVVGTAPDGRRYRAADPHLLTWVSIALTSSFLATDRAYAPSPLGPTDADRFVAEQARGAALLDPSGQLATILPRTTTQLDATFARFAPELGLGPQGREVLGFLRAPRLPTRLRASYLPVFAAAVATLEHDQRVMLGLHLGPLAPLVRTQARTALTALRLATGPSPTLAAATERATSA